ncbi:MAG TPA: hypothetical protein VFZ01_00270 [Geminicoccaceae bacterium]
MQVVLEDSELLLHRLQPVVQAGEPLWLRSGRTVHAGSTSVQIGETGDRASASYNLNACSGHHVPVTTSKKINTSQAAATRRRNGRRKAIISSWGNGRWVIALPASGEPAPDSLPAGPWPGSEPGHRSIHLEQAEPEPVEFAPGIYTFRVANADVPYELGF